MQFMTNNDLDYTGLVWCRANPIRKEVDFTASLMMRYVSGTDVWVPVTGQFAAASASTALECMFNSDESSGTIMMADDLYVGCA
jgi:hypothetical protein